MPEYFLQIVVCAMLGWGGFTWKQSERALTKARIAAERVDKVELKMAEEYLTKEEFENYMGRLFGTLDDIKENMNGSLEDVKKNMRYLTERVDYHVLEQATESKDLRAKLRRLGEE